jgi:hypothetical protein
MSNYYKLQYQLYTTGTKSAAGLFPGMESKAGEGLENRQLRKA